MGKDEAFAVCVVVCALLACKSPETRERERAERAATPKPSAEPTRQRPRVHEHSDAPEHTKTDQVSELAKALDTLRRNPDKTAEGVDKTGKRTITWRFKALPDTDLVELVRYRSDPDAWRFEVSGLPCRDIGQLGLEVSLTRPNRGMAPHYNAEYAVRGGPLDGTVMRVFNQGVSNPRLCTVLPGTQAYWDLANVVATE